MLFQSMAYYDVLYLHNEVDGSTVRLSAFKFMLVVDYLSKSLADVTLERFVTFQTSFT